MTPNLRLRIESSLMRNEGLVLAAYDDATGRPVDPGTLVRGWVSIGYGRNLIGRGITRAEADYLLDNDIAVVEQALDRNLPEWRRWSEPRQWAIFEVGYNLGVERFIAGWPNTVAHLRAGRFVEAANLFSTSRWRQQVGDGRALPIIRAIQRGTWA